MSEGSLLPPVVAVLTAHIGDFTAKMGEAKGEMKAMEGHAERVSQVGKLALGGIALAAGAVALESIKMAGDFQKQTNLLVTAAGETQSNLGLVRNGILDIAKSTGTSTQMLTEGMYQVEKAGIRGADGLKVLKAAAQGAAEEGANLGTVTNAMTSIMASYHLPASRSVEVMNALKTAAGGSKDTMQNFASSLSTVLPIASAAGLDFAQVGGAIAGLTRHGTSAAEATQELAYTIRNLQAPNKVAVKAMEQMGISATEVSQHLGKRGLGGTLEYLVDTIGQHMGPSGLVLIDTFKRSQSAAQDMNAMIAGMPPALRKLTDEFTSGSINIATYSKASKDLPGTQAVLASQFATLAGKTSGFSDALKSGGPLAQTMSAQLKAMLGGSTGLNTALMTTGDNQAYVNEMTTKTSASIHHHTKQVEGWDSTSKLLNTRLGKMHEAVNTLAIKLGTDLIPAVTDTIDWFGRHKHIAEGLATFIGGALTLAIGAYVATLAKAAIDAGISLATMAVDAALWAADMLIAGATALLPFAPIIIAAAAVAVGAYELYKHWDQVWGGIKTVISSAWHDVIRPTVAFIVGTFLDMAGSIVHTAASAFGWIPGIGSDLKDAAHKFDKFRDDVNRSLDGIQKNVGVNVYTHFTPGAVNHTSRPGNAFASGTDYAPGGLSLVGEEGPEMVDLPRGARVHNARDTARMLASPSVGSATGGNSGGGGGGTVVHVTVEGNVLDGRSLGDMVYQAFLIKKREQGVLGLA